MVHGPGVALLGQRNAINEGVGYISPANCRIPASLETPLLLSVFLFATLMSLLLRMSCLLPLGVPTVPSACRMLLSARPATLN